MGFPMALVICTPGPNLSGSVHSSQMHLRDLDVLLAPASSAAVRAACAGVVHALVCPAQAHICRAHGFVLLLADCEWCGLYGVEGDSGSWLPPPILA